MTKQATTGPILGRRTALAMVYLERYGLSLAYFGLAGYHAHRLWDSGSGPFRPEDGVLLASVARQVIQLQLELYVGILLLLGRRTVVPPQNLKDILVPLATTFFNVTYSGVPWLPAGFSQYLGPADRQTIFAATGLGLSLAGLAVAVWGALYLGRSFGVFVEVKQVVLDGPYRWMRHPMYAGYLCLLIGLALANFSAAFFVLVPVHMFLLIYRARLEETRLAEHSSEYRDYRKRSGFVFPKLW